MRPPVAPMLAPVVTERLMTSDFWLLTGYLGSVTTCSVGKAERESEKVGSLDGQGVIGLAMSGASAGIYSLTYAWIRAQTGARNCCGTRDGTFAGSRDGSIYGT